MRKFASERRGFTLIEELLVLVAVVSILSAMMMLSSSEAFSLTKAAAVVS